MHWQLLVAVSVEAEDVGGIIAILPRLPHLNSSYHIVNLTQVYIGYILHLLHLLQDLISRSMCTIDKHCFELKV